MIANLLNQRGFALAAMAGGMVRQTVSFLISMAWDVSDGKFQGPRQLPAGPVQGIKPRAAADVFTRHLFDYELRISKDVERSGLHLGSVLQRLQEGHILGYIVILMADPFGDLHQLPIRFFNNNSNARRPRTSVGTTVNVSD